MFNEKGHETLNPQGHLTKHAMGARAVAHELIIVTGRREHSRHVDDEQIIEDLMTNYVVTVPGISLVHRGVPATRECRAC